MRAIAGTWVAYNLLTYRIHIALVHSFDIHNLAVYTNKKLEELMSNGTTAFHF